jgi:hypothetical protein
MVVPQSKFSQNNSSYNYSNSMRNNTTDFDFLDFGSDKKLEHANQSSFKKA